jgi:anionic cell wall polymer biosynthesis LytR-Cps2A-Psr (LCP) family protein
MMEQNVEQNCEKPKKNINPLKITAIVLSSLAALLVLAAVGIGIFLWYSVNPREGMFSAKDSMVYQPTEPKVQEALIDADWIDENGNAYRYRDNVISILLMGTDYMGNEELWAEGMEFNGGNADVLALVILDTNTFEFSILYIPRDTMAEMIAMDADGNYIDTVRDNICVSHSYGDGGKLSCQLTADAVSRLLLGVPVNRYAALNCEAIYALNDILGGVRITFDYDCTFLDIPIYAGETVTLNNVYLNTLLTYRDYEEVDGAYTRGLRSMDVLKSMFNQLKDKIKENPAVALEIFNQLEDYITTDLALSEITYLASNIGKMNFTSDTVIRLQGETIAGEEYAEFHADPDWIYDFVVEKFCVPAE